MLRAFIALAAAVDDTGTPGTADDTAEPVDPDVLAADDDNDGWSVGDGDCDDARPAVNPGRPETCFDQLDNDCSGFADEQCDDRARLGTLKGGGACTGGENIAGTNALLLPLILAGLAGRRRR